MHKCSKCGHAASSLEEIDAGCPCGSKVFIFDRQIAQAVAAEVNGGLAAGDGEGQMAAGAAGNGGNGSQAEAGMDAPAAFAVPETAKGKAQEMAEGQEGKVPESYFARTTFTDGDIENIKVLTQGVFILDVNAISKNPVVLKDEDEIYYVKLPLVQKKEKAAAGGQAPLQGNEGNGKE